MRAIALLTVGTFAGFAMLTYQLASTVGVERVLSAPAPSVGAFLASVQEDEPRQPHTKDPAECVKYCHPPGMDVQPKGTPEGIEGYECQGDKCARAMEPSEDEDLCKETHKCNTWCAVQCCSCVASCI